MLFFRKKKKKEEDSDEEVASEPKKRRTRKKKEIELPWGRKERLLVFAILALTILFSLFFALQPNF